MYCSLRRLDRTWLLTILGVVALAAGVYATPSGRVGYGVAYFDNAPPATPVPDGFAATDWEWRPLYAGNPPTLTMPHHPSLVGRYHYWQSASTWKSHISSSSPWNDGSLFVLGSGSSAIWRRYATTLYYQVNGTPVPNPQLLSGSYASADYYYSRYAWAGTMNAGELPANWYLDPLRRWVVLSAAAQMDGFDGWSLFDDLGGLYYFEKDEGGEERTRSCGARMGAGGAALFGALLACEYLLKIAYDHQVLWLEEQARLYRASRTPTRDDYYSVDDPSLGRRIIARRAVPNYTVPAGCAASVAPTRNSVGSVGLRTDAMTVTSGTTDTRNKTVTFNAPFTTAAVPFQFSIEPTCTAGTAPGSRFSGRFYLRLHEAGAGSADGWQRIDVAGVKDGSWVSPWAFLAQRDASAGWSSTSEQDVAVPTTFATQGTKGLGLSWAGQVILRALDLGVSHFDKMQAGIEVAATGAADDETTQVQALLSLQPAFTRNVAEAGQWRSVAAGQSVSFSAEESLWPENATSVTCTWDFGDGTTASGPTATHSFATSGVYDVLLTVDPTVPDAAPNAGLFNDAQGGVSYDIRRIAVGQTSPPGGSTDPGAVNFAGLRLTAKPTQLVAQFATDVPARGKLYWTILPPGFVGPPGPGQYGDVTDVGGTTTHSLTYSGAQSGTPYYVTLSAIRAVDGAQVSARYDLAEAWPIVTPLAGTADVILDGATPPVRCSAPTVEATPGEARVRWTSSIPTSTRLQWSDNALGPPGSAARAGNVETSDPVTSHDVTVTGLNLGTTYYFHLSGCAPGAPGSTYLRNAGPQQSYHGPTTWPIAIPSRYESGSRSGDWPCLEYLTAVSGGDGKLSVRVALSAAAQTRLLHRPYGAAEWLTTDWGASRSDPTWTLPLAVGAYELAVEIRREDGGVSASAIYSVVHQLPTEAAVTCSLEARSVTVSDGARLTFRRPFSAPPIVLVSAARSGAPLAACAVDVGGKGCRLSVLDAAGGRVKQAKVQYLAVLPGDPAGKVQGACAQLQSGANVRFAAPFQVPPVVVCNAQKGGKALLAAAVNNRTDGFTLKVCDLSGKAVNGAWVQWLAVPDALTVTLPDGKTAGLRGGIQQVADGVTLPVGVRSPTRGAAVMSSQQSATPLLCAPTAVTSNSLTVGLRRHDGRPASGAWLQWLVASM